MIDFFDYIAFLQFCHTAVGIDAGDHNAAHIVWQIELTRTSPELVRPRELMLVDCQPFAGRQAVAELVAAAGFRAEERARFRNQLACSLIVRFYR